MMLSRFLLPALVVGLAAPAFAQKPVAVSPLEVGSDPVAQLAPDGQTFLRSARPALLTAIDAPTASGPAETKARAFLASRGGTLGLRTSDASDLALERVRTGRSGTNVRFRQTVGGVPVWGPETVVTLDRQDRVQALANGYRDDLSAVDIAPDVSADAAKASVYAHLGMNGEPFFEASELVVWPSTPARLAWSVRVEGGAPNGSWEGVVDAHTGEMLRVADRAAYHRNDTDRPGPTALPLADLSPLFRSVDGTGFIFDPNPLTRAGVAYGGQYVDNNDADTPALTAARTAATLRGLTFNGSNYRLVGPWAEIIDFELPNRGLFDQSSSNFDFTRNASAFEAVTTYWHIDNYMRYVNVELGVDATPQAYSSGVRFDPHGLVNPNDPNQAPVDNSYFLSQSDRLSFGEGCVDDAEDADVIIHELGHGLHDWLSAISNSLADGLSEGFGDYVATSYTRSLGLLQPSDASYNWVFKWDGHNPCWGGRRTNVTTTYPGGGQLHGVGQNWSTSNMRVWDQLGREATDVAVFEGIAMGNSSTTQPQAAQAVLQAAANMGYSNADIQVFFDSYVTQGYNPSFPVAAEDVAAAEAAGVLLSAASPNPFNGLTTFDVMVDRPQAVTVEVFDAVGRKVATLFSGEMTGGQRFPMSLDSADLQSGVYVVRVTGESVATTRRVTVVR